MKRWLAVLFLFGGTLCASDIVVVSMAIGKDYQKVVIPGIENKQRYCKKHGYAFVLEKQQLDRSRPISWSKIPLLLQVMDESDCQWLFWNDADTLIMNSAIPLEDFIDPNYDLILCNGYDAINFGNFLIRNNERARTFLRKVYAHEECIHHRWWENRAVILELEQNEEFRNRTKVLPQRLFNSYSSPPHKPSEEIIYQKGDFIIHFAGVMHHTYLNMLFKQYSRLGVESTRLIDIDSYLSIYGIEETGPKLPQSWPQQVSSAALIGLHAGHFLFHLLQNCPSLENVICSDRNHEACTAVAHEFFSRFYRDQFLFVEEDQPSQKVDLICIDGARDYQTRLEEILDCQKLAHEDTIVWIHDFDRSSVRKAVEECVSRGVLETVETQSEWLEAKYIFSGNLP